MVGGWLPRRCRVQLRQPLEMGDEHRRARTRQAERAEEVADEVAGDFARRFGVGEVPLELGEVLVEVASDLEKAAVLGKHVVEVERSLLGAREVFGSNRMHRFLEDGVKSLSEKKYCPLFVMAPVFRYKENNCFSIIGVFATGTDLERIVY